MVVLWVGQRHNVVEEIVLEDAKLQPKLEAGQAVLVLEVCGERKV